MIELTTPPAPGSLMRARRLATPGVFRLARRWAELYSVQIVGSGTWSRIRCYDGTGVRKFEQISAFTGSFWLSAACEKGLIVEVHARYAADCPNLMINWREQNAKLV